MLTMQQPLYSETEVKALGTKHKKTGNYECTTCGQKSKIPIQTKTPSYQDALEFSAIL